jgi:hypothetical protein
VGRHHRAQAVRGDVHPRAAVRAARARPHQVSPRPLPLVQSGHVSSIPPY